MTEEDGSIRVLVLFSSGEIGGAERSITRMVMASSDAKVRYELATVGGVGAWREWLRSEGIACTCYSIFEARGMSINRLLRFVIDRWRSPVDIIYAVGLRAAAVARITRLFGFSAKVVHGIRSTYPDGSQLARSFRLSETFLRFLTAGYIANTVRGASDLQRLVSLPSAKMHVIPNGVSFPSAAPNSQHRAKAIAVVANINQYKGHEEFLEVVSLVVQRVPDVAVLYVGRNDAGESITEAIQLRGLTEVVKLLGYQLRPESIVRDARVFALPSPRIEGCPTAVLEAMAAGLPVVAYRVGGLGEVVASGRTGYLIEPGDHEGFANALVELLTNTELNDRMGAESRRMVESNFSLHHCARSHALVWNTLLPLRHLSNDTAI